MLMSQTFDENKISTRDELIAHNFRLAGDATSLDLIQNHGRMVGMRPMPIWATFLVGDGKNGSSVSVVANIVTLGGWFSSCH